MTTGIVNAALEATIPLLVHDAKGPSQVVDAVLDTGFSGKFTMPPALVKSLQLPWIRRNLGVLADGSQHWFDVYEVTVTWNGQPRLVRVEAADNSPLVGMEFLKGCELRIQVVPGGTVSVDAIP